VTVVFNVRIFGYRGLQQLAEFLPTKENATRPLRLNEPYEWAQVIAVNDPASNTVFSTPVNPDISTLLKIEIPDGQMVQYDINKAIDLKSPFMTGTQIIQWNQGWKLSLIQAFATGLLLDDFGPSPGAILTDDSSGALLHG
jgi:hypothetical protein